MGAEMTTAHRSVVLERTRQKKVPRMELRMERTKTCGPIPGGFNLTHECFQARVVGEGVWGRAGLRRSFNNSFVLASGSTPFL